jgi:hypothetical protein
MDVLGRAKTSIRKVLLMAGWEVRRRPTDVSASGGLPRSVPTVIADIYRSVRPRAMAHPQQVIVLCDVMRFITETKVPGAVVECGVWRGGTMAAAARMLQALGENDRDLFLFDTFEGMSEPTQLDMNFDGTDAIEAFPKRLREDGASDWCYADLDDVQDGMASTGYPAEHLHFVKGKVEETLPDEAPERISVLRLDTDWYESTRHEMEHLFHRLSPGGVLILDDYDAWEGARQAVDEFLAKQEVRLLLVRVGVGRVALVP